MPTQDSPKEERKLLAIRNISTGGIIKAGSPLFENLSASRHDVDDKGHVRHIEMIHGQPRELMVNLGGQFRLDQKNRGGKRLYERIYDQERLIQLEEEKGIVMRDPKQKPKESEAPKKRRGRPKKDQSEVSTSSSESENLEEALAAI